MELRACSEKSGIQSLEVFQVIFIECDNLELP